MSTDTETADHVTRPEEKKIPRITELTVYDVLVDPDGVRWQVIAWSLDTETWHGQRAKLELIRTKPQ